MRPLPRCAVGVLVALSVLPAARAQGRLAFGGVPAVGSFAEFAMTIEQEGKLSTGRYRVACLEKTRIDGIDHLWCEVARAKGQKLRVIRILLPEADVAASDTPLSSAREVIYQDAGKKAMRASGAALQSVVSLLASVQGDAPLTYASEGREDLTLPDGSRVTAFRKSGQTDISLPDHDRTRVESTIWVVKDIPFGVCKRVVITTEGKGAAERKKVETLVLTGHGMKGAQSQVIGPIVAFNPLDLLLGK